MNQNHIARPAVDELLELVQTRLGMTEDAAREYINALRPGFGASAQVNGVDELHSMPDLIVARLERMLQQ